MIAIRTAAALLAAGLVVLSAKLPLWSMTMKAPQYPKGLRLDAYGSAMTGDVREINIINHYIGMPPIEMPSLETALFPVAIMLLVALCLVAPLHRWLRRLAVVAVVATPIGILIDLQWWLYRFGHSLDPKAPIRMPPFTPLVIGVAKLGNFVTTSTVSSGILCLLAAALVLVAGERLSRRFGDRTELSRAAGVAAGVAAMLMLTLAWPAAAARPTSLQARIDAAPRGGTLVVDGGVHGGPIVIRGPLEVVGKNRPVVDGGAAGSVVTLEGDNVIFRGFAVRNSGRHVTEEAAGIRVSGSGHRIEDNDIRDVYFGIHIAGGGHHVVENNRIAPGERHGARPGHGISVWHATDSRLSSNRISHARDGIYLSFTDKVVVSGNRVSECRYGVHSMYSRDAEVADNTISANLLGAALMLSDRLVLRGNRIEQHRAGTAAYGVLLKDIGSLVAEDNVIVSNRIGIYAEGVAMEQSREAVIARNTIAGNEVGLALQGTATLTLTENRIADNLIDVRPLGRQLSAGTRWSREGRGNFWGQYRGYDADADGIGDVPHRVEDAMDALVRRSPLAQAFLYTPAHLALEAAARMFPLFRQDAVVIDTRPLMTTKGRGSR